jgi:hypothetical protein
MDKLNKPARRKIQVPEASCVLCYAASRRIANRKTNYELPVGLTPQNPNSAVYFFETTTMLFKSLKTCQRD